MNDQISPIAVQALTTWQKNTSVAIVYVLTKDKPVVTGKPDMLAVENLDEGEDQ